MDLPAADVPPGEDVLWQAGAVSVSVRDARDAPVLEPAPGTTPIWPHCRIEALFAAHDTDADRLLERLRRELASGRDWRLTELADRDWQRDWRDTLEPMRFGERLWIYPSHQAPPDGLSGVVRLDPGLAFGSGTHPTTALCLEWLESQPLRQRTVLDYGCGCGVLAIAALVLGARQAIAVDNDPQALQATRDNARRNNVGERLQVLAHTPWPDPRADTIVANILAGPLIELAPRLAASHRRGGSLALAGILASQQAQVRRAYRGWYTFERPRRREDWILLRGTRNDERAAD